jgi:hypothetical protein
MTVKAKHRTHWWKRLRARDWIVLAGLLKSLADLARQLIRS